MRVLHIITGLGEGGAEAVLTRLCEADRGNLHVVISLMDEGKYGSRLRDAGVEVFTLGMRRGHFSMLKIFNLWDIVRRNKPDIVQTWLYHADLVGGLVARLAGTSKVVWNIRNTEMAPGLASRATILVAKACARLSFIVPTKIVVCADKAASEHALLGYNTAKMVVIHNGYDLELYCRSEAAGRAFRERIGVPAGVPLIGLVARYDPQKDHRNFLIALKRVKDAGIDFRCVMVGRGVTADCPELSLLVAQLGLTGVVMLHGPETDIVPVMSALDLHVMASAYGEGFPNVVAEAMACGTPCVVTDVGDAALIVGNAGWVVPPSSPTHLAEAISLGVGAVSSLEGKKDLRKDVRARISTQFSIDSMVCAYNRVWAGVKSDKGAEVVGASPSESDDLRAQN